MLKMAKPYEDTMEYFMHFMAQPYSEWLAHETRRDETTINIHSK